MIKLEEKVPYLPREMMLEAVSWDLRCRFQRNERIRHNLHYFQGVGGQAEEDPRVGLNEGMHCSRVYIPSLVN
jgi:hypothetical protein